MKPIAAMLTGFLLSASLMFAGDSPVEPVEAEQPALKTPVVATIAAPDRDHRLDQLQDRLEQARRRLDTQFAWLNQNHEPRPQHGDQQSDERAERRHELSRDAHDEAGSDSKAATRRAEAARLRELRETAERRRRQRAAERQRRLKIQFMQRREAANQSYRDRGEITDHFRVGDLLATVPGQRNPVFDSPEGLMRTLRILADETDGRRGGQLDFERRARILNVTGRPEFVRRVRNQLRRFRQIENDTILVTARLLFVPNDADIAGSRRAARLLSGDRRAQLVDQYEGDVGEASRRDHLGHHTIPNGGLIYVCTWEHQDIASAHRGVNVVIDLTPDGNAVTIAPIPLAGDAGKVAWQTIRVAPGQCAVYELPAVIGPDGEPDNTRVLAFITVDAIIPGQ